MADVTISSLPLGTPSGNHLIPFTTGSSTLAAPVSSFFQYSRPMAAVRRISKFVGNNIDYRVIWDIADINIGNVYNTNTGVFTAPLPGIYYFGAWMIAKANNTFAEFFFRKNGVDLGIRPYAGGASQPYWQVTGFYIFNLNAGDTMDITAPTSYPYWSANEVNSGAVFYLLG